MDLEPDFNRFLAAVHHKETDRVPLGEILIDYSVQSKFLGRTVTVDDLAGQVEFWAKAGYDFIPLTVSMMSPGVAVKIFGAQEMVLQKNWHHRLRTGTLDETSQASGH
jgi:uroporphyrinogen decarboxylase